MRRRSLKNVTITVEPDVAHWTRTQAARANTSVSRLVGELLREHMGKEEGYAGSMERALARRAFLKSDGEYLTREQLHDRARLR